MFASFLSVIAIFGVALGVFSLVVVISVMNGFSKNLQEKLMGFGAHITVNSLSIDLKDIKNIASSAVIIEGEGVIQTESSSGDNMQGVKILGIDKLDYNKLKGVNWYFSSRVREPAAILIGSDLSFNMDINPDYEEDVWLISPIGRVSPTGELTPEKMKFRTGGTFESGYFEYDSKYVIVPKKAAIRLLGDNARVATQIWLKDFGAADSVKKTLAQKFPDLKISTWADSNKKLFSALKLERIAMTVLLTLIIIIAGISIVSVIFMYVFLRRKDIAILSAIGADPKKIRNIFIRLGGYIGILGSVIGVALGYLVCIYIAKKGINLPASYYLDRLPVLISWKFFMLVGIAGVLLSMLAAYYPARQAGSFKPQELLRYE